jgi:hypothetical protein
VKTLSLVVCVLCFAVPCFAQTFTLNAVSNCPDLPAGYQIALIAGTYNIEYVSGAWSPIANDAIYGGYAWSSRVNVYVYSTLQSGIIGSPAIPGLYQSPELAEAAAKGTYVLLLPFSGVVSFYLSETINNFNNCGDNRGSVTLKFVFPLATEGSTWGAIKALYR